MKPRKDKKDNFTLRLDENRLIKIKKEAHTKSISLAEVLRRLIDEHLE